MLRAYDALANFRVRIFEIRGSPHRHQFLPGGQFSVLANLQLKAQSKAVHALTFVGLCGRENQMQDLGAPRLAMLPSV